MSGKIHPAGKLAARIFLWLLFFLIVLTAIIQLAAATGFAWLRSEAGQSWLAAQMAGLAREGGYGIEIGRVDFNPVQGITLTQVRLHDREGEFLNADRMAVRLSLASLAGGSVRLAIDGGKLKLLRLPSPEKKVEKDSAPLMPFSLPETYINQASLSLHVDSIVLEAPVAGQEIKFSPSLAVDARVDNGEASFNAEANLEYQKEEVPAWLTKTLSFEGKFSPQTLVVLLENFSASAEAYKLAASGQVGLAEGGEMDVALALGANAGALAGQAGFISLQAGVSGAVTKPLLTAQGLISLDALRDQGMEDVSLSIVSTLEENLPVATVNLDTFYQEKPISLMARARYEAPLLQVEALEGHAPDIRLSGKILADTSSMLADGNISLTIADFSSYADLAGVSATGAAQADAEFSSHTGKQDIRVKLRVENAAYDTMSLQSLTASAFVPDVMAKYPTQIEANLTGLDLGASGSIDKAGMALTEKGNDFYNLAITASGQVIQPFKIAGKSLIAGLQSGNPSASAINLAMTAKGSTVTLKGDASRESLNLKAETRKFSLSSLPVELPPQVQNMKLSGTASLSGPPSSPILDSAISLSSFNQSLRAGGPSADLNLSASASYRNGKAQASLKGTGKGISRLNADVSLPISVSLYPYQVSLADDAALQGQGNFALSGRVLSRLVLTPDHFFTGDINGKIDLKGTMSSPSVFGNLSLSEGRYRYNPYGIGFADFTAKIGFNQEQATINLLSATDGDKGRLSGKGQINFSSPAKTSLSLIMKDFHLARSRTADGIISANLALKGQETGYFLSGEIRPGPLDIVIPERFKSDIPELNIVQKNTAETDGKALANILLDLSLIADNQIFVRGWGLDAEFGGNVEVTGNLGAPLMNGSFSSQRGRYEEFGKRFTLERANLRFQGSVPPSPYLDVEATVPAEDVTASIVLGGPVSAPKITFSSTPALPEDEVLSRILFGRSMTKISPFQAIQLAQTLQRFSGNGGNASFDPLGTLRSVTGLDDINVDTDASGETSVGVGKYLTDKVYLEVKKGQGEKSGAANLQVEVTPSLTLESEIGQDAEAGGGAFWKWDY